MYFGGVLLVMFWIVKEFSMVWLVRLQIVFQKVILDLVQFLGEIYIEKMVYWQEFFMKGWGDEDDVDYVM